MNQDKLREANSLNNEITDLQEELDRLKNIYSTIERDGKRGISPDGSLCSKKLSKISINDRTAFISNEALLKFIDEQIDVIDKELIELKEKFEKL